MANYKSTKTVRAFECPFFISETTMTIRCTCVIKAAHTKITFDNADDKRKWSKNICRSQEHCGFGKCPYFLMLEKMSE